MFKSQKPQLQAWQAGEGRGPAGGRSRLSMLDAAESPGEIRVKGSSPAEEEAGPLFINQRGQGCTAEGETHPAAGPSSGYLSLV